MVFLKRYMEVVFISNRFKVLLVCLLLTVSLYFYSTRLGVKCDKMIPDIQENEKNLPPKGRCIFFIETSKKQGKDSVVSLSVKQACSVESAAKLNPDKIVYVLFTVPLLYPNLDQCTDSACVIIRDLLKYSNVKLRSVNMVRYFEGTPLENWWHKGELANSSNLIEHTSDVMRLLTLWKFGGTYLDLDFMVLKSFKRLAINFAGSESETIVASAALNVDHTNFGHEIIERCLREIEYNFCGDEWSHNGPDLITRVMNEVCNTNKTHDMTIKACNGFQVLPKAAFYPVHYSLCSWIFSPGKADVVHKMIKNMYALHLSNKISHDVKISQNDTSIAYTRLAKIKCPNMFKEM